MYDGVPVFPLTLVDAALQSCMRFGAVRFIQFVAIGAGGSTSRQTFQPPFATMEEVDVSCGTAQFANDGQ